MHSGDITFEGPAIDDPSILDRLSAAHRAFLAQRNGVIAFGGGLHIRGACRQPAWHALRTAWEGPLALHTLYRAVQPGDVPFAEDALGDQFLERDEMVYRLHAETGEVVALGCDLNAFLESSCADPIGFLQLAPLQQFWSEGGHLEPGQLVNVYPPFCTTESRKGVSLRAIPSGERISWLAAFAAQIRDLPDGSSVQITLTP
ncbi:MAG TPA: hypothetical protein VFK13_13105 [Gemmatimonadaceae bacterium]|nr:hypothetical protein [Gemmatimonadaceae bacterium]